MRIINSQKKEECLLKTFEKFLYALVLLFGLFAVILQGAYMTYFIYAFLILIFIFFMIYKTRKTKEKYVWILFLVAFFILLYYLSNL